MTEEVKKQGGFHYAFLIVAACICFCAACSLMVNYAGVYMPSVTKTFGASSAEFMLYFTILQLAMAITLPVAGKVMNNIDLRVLFTVSGILCFIGTLILSNAQALWMLYVGGLFEGVGTAPLLFLAVPKLIGAWCADKVGFFTGLALAFTGIGGVIFNPVQQIFINMGPEGWRMGYLAAGIILLILVLPFSIFVIRNTPADKGMKPYGFEKLTQAADPSAAEALNKGIDAAKAMKTLAFYAVAVVALLYALNQTVYQMFPAYCNSFANSFPEIAALSATIASVCMVGLTIGKILLGAVNDKNSKGGIVVSVGLGIIGVILLMFFPTAAPLLLIGAFLFGFVYAGTTVQSTLLTRIVFGNRDYANIYSRVSMCSSVGGAFAATLWGIIVDLPNGYFLMFCMSLVIMVLIAIFSFYAVSQAKKYAGQSPDTPVADKE